MWKWFKGLEKQDKQITYWAFILLFVVTWIQLKFGEDNMIEFGNSLLPNFFADIINVLVTVSIINHFIKRNQEKKEKQQLYEILGQPYTEFVCKIAGNYFLLLTKKKEFRDNGFDGLLGIRQGMVEIQKSEELIDVSTVFKSQEEIKDILHRGWRTSFMSCNSDFCEYVENYGRIDVEIKELYRKYLDENGCLELEHMSAKDKKYLELLESELENMKGEYKFFWRTSKFIRYYNDYTVKVIDGFVSKYELILPFEIKVALFRLKNDLADLLVDISKTHSTKPSQQEKEQIQKIMSNITKELSFLLDYFKEYEDAS